MHSLKATDTAHLCVPMGSVADVRPWGLNPPPSPQPHTPPICIWVSENIKGFSTNSVSGLFIFLICCFLIKKKKREISLKYFLLSVILACLFLQNVCSKLSSAIHIFFSRCWNVWIGSRITIKQSIVKVIPAGIYFT